MRVPIRKPGKFTHQKADAHMTRSKYEGLKEELERLTHVKRPRLAEEVRRLATDGDFSENHAYQMAKGRLRGINQRILEIEDLLKRAEIITRDNAKGVIQIGHRVTLESEGKTKIFTILGSSETDPGSGIISHTSPLGSALMGRKSGDEVSISLPGREKIYKILKIE